MIKSEEIDGLIDTLRVTLSGAFEIVAAMERGDIDAMARISDETDDALDTLSPDQLRVALNLLCGAWAGYASHDENMGHISIFLDDALVKIRTFLEWMVVE